MRHDPFICLIFAFLAMACGRASNSLDESVLICGSLANPEADYIVVHGPDGLQLESSELEIYSLETRRLHEDTAVSAKGCLQVQAANHGKLLVKAKGKPWIARLNRETGSLQLKEAVEQNLVVNCSPQKRVNPHVTLDELLNASQVNDPEAFLIESRSGSPSASLVHPYAPKNPLALLPQDWSHAEYLWQVTITDIFRDVQVQQECLLIVDAVAPQIKVSAERSQATEHDGVKFHLTDRSSRLQFEIASRPLENDLDFIEYCADSYLTFAEFSEALTASVSAEPCSHPLRTQSLQVQITGSNRGFWIVRFKARDTSGNDSGWQSPYPLLYYHGEELRSIEALTDPDRSLALLTRPSGPKKLIDEILAAMQRRDQLTTDFERSIADRHLLRSVPYLLAQLPPFMEVKQILSPREFASIAISPDSQQIVAGLQDGTIKRWSASTGKAIEGNLAKHDYSVNSVGFDPSGRLLLSADDYGHLRIWNLEKDGPEAEARDFAQGDTGPVTRERVLNWQFVPGTTQLVLGMHSGAVRILDWQQGPGADKDLLIPPATASAYRPSILQLSLLDDKTIVSMHEDGNIHFWDLLNRAPLGQTIRPFETFWGQGAFHLLSGKSQLVAWSNSEGFPFDPNMWDIASREKVKLRFSITKSMTELKFFNDDNYLLAKEGGSLNLYDSSSRAILQTLGSRSTSFNLAPDGSKILTHDDTRELDIWARSHANGEITFLPKDDLDRHLWITAAAIDSNQTRIVVVQDDGAMELFDLKTGRSIRKFRVSDESNRAVGAAISPNGEVIAVGFQSGNIHLVNTASGNSSLLSQQPEPVSKLVFLSRDLLMTNGGSIRIWDMKTMTEQSGPSEFKEARSMVIYDDGRRMAYAAGTRIHFWDLERMAPIQGSMPMPAASHSTTIMAVNPSGTLLALANESDKNIWLYDLKAQKLLSQNFENSSSRIMDLRFASDEILVTTAEDLALRIWSIPLNELLTSIVRHGEFATISLKLIGPLKDGRMLSVGADGTVRQWLFDPWLQRKQICQNLGSYFPEACAARSR